MLNPAFVLLEITAARCLVVLLQVGLDLFVPDAIGAREHQHACRDAKCSLSSSYSRKRSRASSATAAGLLSVLGECPPDSRTTVHVASLR
jgi:hypothetical protein